MANDDQNEQGQEESAAGLRGMYEDEKRQRAEAQTQLSALQRKEAFRDAGLDPSKPLHGALMRAYEGELDPDKVKAYVAELDLPAAAPPPPPSDSPPPAPPAEREALERIANAGTGDGQPPADPNRRDQIRKRMEEAARRGNLQEMDILSIEFAEAGGFPVVEPQ